MILFSFKLFWADYSGEIFLMTVIVLLIILVTVQAKQIHALREELNKSMSSERYDEIVAFTKESLDTNGEIQTIKMIRKKTGMSLVETKNLVDTLKQKT